MVGWCCAATLRTTVGGSRSHESSRSWILVFSALSSSVGRLIDRRSISCCVILVGPRTRWGDQVRVYVRGRRPP